MSYDGKCGSCAEFEDVNGGQYDKNNSDYIKGYCAWYHAYYYPDDSCHHYKGTSSGGGCYITTMVCNVLGYEDDCDVLNTMRSLRNDVLQKDPKYSLILYEYDTIGPKIAEKLQKEDASFVKKIYEGCLLPIVDLIKNKNNEKAINKYVEMTRSLEECYGLQFNLIVPKNYDYKNGGHGQKTK